MFGSISWLGVADLSQWDTEDPVSRELGVYISGCPAASFPEVNTLAESIVTWGPFHTTLPKFMAEAARSASVICGQVLPVLLSNRNLS